jgi:hypothetical protein
VSKTANPTDTTANPYLKMDGRLRRKEEKAANINKM